MQVSSCINNISRYLEDLKPYFTKRILVIFVLGFASGLPILMTLSTLTYWLAKFNVTKTNIGLLTLAGLPYALKFLWSPFLDYFSAPLIGHLGKRKSWIIFFQLIICLIFAALVLVNPADHIWIIAVLILILSFASASQDIVIDAYRIDFLVPSEQGYGVAANQMGYRIAMLVTGVGMLSLSDFIDWSWLFAGLSGLMLLIFCHSFFISEPCNDIDVQRMEYRVEPQSHLSLFVQNFEGMVVMPFRDFLLRNHAILILFFVLCFKLPDVVSGIMAMTFYKEMGYTGTQIGAVTKIYGFFAGFLGIFLGAILVKQLGLYRTLIISVAIMGISNLSYLLIAHLPTLSMLVVAISIENIAGGIASTTFIMFLSLLCNRQYSATQYALLSSLAAVAVRLLGPITGGLASYFPWDQFFIITSCLFIPALCFLIYIKKDVCLLYKINEEKLEK